MPADVSISRRSDLAASETTASSPRRAKREGSRMALLARMVAMPSRRLSWADFWASVVSSSSRTWVRSSRTSRAMTWNFVRTEEVATGPRCTAVSTSRTARASTGMMPVVVVGAAPSLRAGRRTARAGLALASSSQETPPLECNATLAAAGGPPHAVAPPGELRHGTDRTAAPGTRLGPTDLREIAVPGQTARPRWNRRPSVDGRPPSPTRSAVGLRHHAGRVHHHRSAHRARRGPRPGCWVGSSPGPRRTPRPPPARPRGKP